MTLALAVVAVGGLAGCGEDNKVGDESLLNFEEQAGERLGQTTTTTAPPVESTTTTGAGGAGGAPSGEAQAPKATATTSPPTTRPAAVATTATTATTAPAASVATLEIAINGDTSADPPLDPREAAVYVGSVVRWVNRDTVPRSVQATNGAFRSPMIPPGGTFDYQATRVTPEPIAYGDGTRPYVNATLEVLAKP